ncbi:hypothetical protein SISNIDRAFT_528435 [Sistotremastrum niveocremeum HHB9708]|uniref:Uncharacterized protein n=1 Tax=Sistotremastrum niveocremeum HHB9708 TaxID=1314777 RepID=A0A164PLG6_9AGAM|nr:hypothetical protein SISNIDRAFT_528435 [Sistotremastrum niveocremeum HHB9708]
MEAIQGQADDGTEFGGPGSQTQDDEELTDGNKAPWMGSFVGEFEGTTSDLSASCVGDSRDQGEKLTTARHKEHYPKSALNILHIGSSRNVPAFALPLIMDVLHPTDTSPSPNVQDLPDAPSNQDVDLITSTSRSLADHFSKLIAVVEKLNTTMEGQKATMEKVETTLVDHGRKFNILTKDALKTLDDQPYDEKALDDESTCLALY